ncbi:MAG TPA: indolepyruvate oxidoreductase subunit beta [Desulfobacterales bacterium]|nr:indolepyruvate oxidoreductase subunit beta [Desulfobacterales bacterium]
MKGGIIFCGVGGQGILLASEITAFALMATGFTVKKSEVHGMAQRGGSVVAHLRYGQEVYAPLIGQGAADFILSLEKMETARYLNFMHEQTQIVASTHQIAPPAVAMGQAAYPVDILEQIRDKGLALLSIDSFAIARELGEVRAANVVLVGALSTFLPVTEETFIEVMKSKLPARILDLNLRAFAAGRQEAA